MWAFAAIVPFVYFNYACFFLSVEPVAVGVVIGEMSAVCAYVSQLLGTHFNFLLLPIIIEEADERGV